ncbi:putative disease resistance protein At5g05400 [Bidens hawaiensis]|uniref:putative disease resistance protein At5g05400 n=1 Tax=Bidens hawaiensis TaxID=980011 RepID=UPI00404B5B96
MEFITLILTPVVESLLVPVKRHLGFLVFSSSMVTNMNAKVRELEGAEGDTRTQQQRNIENSRVVPRRVPGWLAEVEKIKASKETIPTAGGGGCCNIKAKYIAGKKSSKILKEINRLMNEKAAMEWTDQIIPVGTVSPPRPSTSEAVHEEDQNQKEYQIKSRDLIFKKALKSLEPSNNVTTKMMALCGMGGVGKTTMMEDLKKVATEKKMFDYIVKVEVGKNPNPISIQQVVAEYLGEALTETTKDTRADRLKKRIENILKEGKKKILVILDDVWEKFNLGDIGLASPLSNGFKLLFTSRDEHVCNQMGVETSLIFKIVVLQEEEARKLFSGIIGLGPDTDPDMHRIGEDILKRCGGLPIAINTIASTLKVNKKRHAWNDLLNRFEKKMFQGLDRIKAIFEISYINLKDDDLKAMFILSGLFPEDYNIDKEDLLRYGWGLNFFKEMYTIATARDRVHTCVDTLIGLNLLIKSDHEQCVKMHDLVRDFVLSNFTEVKQASIVNHDNNLSEQLRKEVSYERILWNCGDNFELTEDFNQPNLALLTLMDGQLLNFSQDFLTNLEKLEVVAYENMDLKFLPQYSTNLRVLSLHSCSLVDHDISFFGDLINLEILDLSHCGIKNLPSKIGKLKRLRLLDLTRCDDRLCIDDGVIQNLDKLEELYMEVKGQYLTLRFTEANCNELKMILNKLSTCGGYSGVFFQTSVDGKNIYQNGINTMSMKERSKVARNMSVFPSYHITPNFHHLCNIQLIRIQGVEVVFEIESLSNKDDQLVTNEQQRLPLLPYLEDLRLYGMPNLTHVWKCSNWNEFFTLHKLQPQSSFQNLTYISHRSCDSLKYLFSPLMAKLLSSLKIVRILCCDGMEEVVSNRDDKDEETKMYTAINTTIALFPHLDILNLTLMENLKHIGGGVTKDATNVSHSQSKFSQLDVVHWSLCQYSRQIYIEGCHALSCVIQSYAAGPMQLQELSIVRCNAMEEVFETKEINDNNISGCSSSTATMKNSIVYKLSNLKTLKVSACDSLGNIFTFSTLESIKKLETLEISMCKAMKVIVKEEYGEAMNKDVVIFPKLKSIQLGGLPNLVGFFLGMNIDFQFPLLDHVGIDGCPQMIVFTSGWSTTPKLMYMHTALGKHILERGLNFHVTPTSHLGYEFGDTS